MRRCFRIYGTYTAVVLPLWLSVLDVTRRACVKHVSSVVCRPCSAPAGAVASRVVRRVPAGHLAAWGNRLGERRAACRAAGRRRVPRVVVCAHRTKKPRSRGVSFSCRCCPMNSERCTCRATISPSSHPVSKLRIARDTKNRARLRIVHTAARRWAHGLNRNTRGSCREGMRERRRTPAHFTASVNTEIWHPFTLGCESVQRASPTEHCTHAFSARVTMDA